MSNGVIIRFSAWLQTNAPDKYDAVLKEVQNWCNTNHKGYDDLEHAIANILGDKWLAWKTLSRIVS